MRFARGPLGVCSRFEGGSLGVRLGSVPGFVPM